MTNTGKQNKISFISVLLSVFSGVAVLVLDRLTKQYVAKNFVLNGQAKRFIPNVIDLTYIHNSGGAWGILADRTVVLIAVTLIIMLLCLFIYFKYGVFSKILSFAMMLVLFGGIGNMYDRIFNGGNVVDFIHLEFMPAFPVFNIADCGVVIGAGLLVLYFIVDTINEKKENKKVGDVNGENNDAV